jgi:hypothetical protein
MKAHQTSLQLEFWNNVCVGFQDPEDYEKFMPLDCRNIMVKTQALF